MLPEQFIIIAVIVNLIGYFWYVKNMVLENTKPNLVSWFIWMFTPFIGIFFQIRAGATLSVLPILMGGFLSLVIIFISLFRKNAYWKINSFDIICGIISLIALILYVFTHNLSISILFAIISDALAYFPTILKSWNFPNTETGLLYTTGIISNVLGLLIIKMWIFPIYSFGISVIFFNSIVLFCIYREKIFRRKIIF